MEIRFSEMQAWKGENSLQQNIVKEKIYQHIEELLSCQGKRFRGRKIAELKDLQKFQSLQMNISTLKNSLKNLEDHEVKMTKIHFQDLNKNKKMRRSMLSLIYASGMGIAGVISGYLLIKEYSNLIGFGKNDSPKCETCETCAVALKTCMFLNEIHKDVYVCNVLPEYLKSSPSDMKKKEI